uniref:Uncharacterized protein n=1 Tax=Anguilla anguilla TaxID=7936 RepID=A0A0E9R0W4_ANGAN
MVLWLCSGEIAVRNSNFCKRSHSTTTTKTLAGMVEPISSVYIDAIHYRNIEHKG